jgi:hypothetical protein
LADDEHEPEPEADAEAEPEESSGEAAAAPDEAEPSGAEPGEDSPPGPGPTAGTSGAMPSMDDLLAALNQIKVGELLLSTVSTLASIAYGRIESRDLGEARTAIDAIGALLPVLEGQVDAAIRRDFEQALTNLRLAYADAVASAE